MRRLIAVLAVVVGTGLAAQPAAAQVPPASYTCTPQPADCSGWNRTDVVLRWFAPTATATNNCPVAAMITAEGVTNWDCGVSAPPASPDWVWARATIHIDKSVPRVTTATPSRPPDANGWYRAPVAVSFAGDDAISGIASCTSTTYARPDSVSAAVQGTCTDVAGHVSAPLSYPLRYDATGPDVKSAKPSRKPDRGRWYKRPVTWRFTGEDALSGLLECPRVRYAGPDGPQVRVIGACVDKAGNVTGRGFSFRYDATPPERPAVRPIARDRAVKLRIRTARDVRRITIVRAPGRGGTRDSTVYRGRPRSFTDVHVLNGKRYRYRVTALDAAANRSRRRVSAVAGPRLLAPADGATLSAPPLLRWTPVRGADYYNVQLRRNGRKVLSRWPTKAEYQLQPRWRFEGRFRHFRPATYRWHVWPGFGRRSAAVYGSRIGSRSFVVPDAATARR